jgi:DNA-binding response OmpR family regulator
LTFRENKLLLYFANHPNQVLEREEILANVWGDEGLIVGRSLDVFVSRLRKILKNDTTLQLKNIHGIGYRLEIQPGSIA